MIHEPECGLVAHRPTDTGEVLTVDDEAAVVADVYGGEGFGESCPVCGECRGRASVQLAGGR